MSTPEHAIAHEPKDRSVVKVGRQVADFISRDAERPGLWIIEDPDGRFMGRHHDREAGAAFLATWFAAHDDR